MPLPKPSLARHRRPASPMLAAQKLPSAALHQQWRTADPLGGDRALTELPAWLQRLLWLKQITTVSAILACLTVLGLYSWTVYTQQRWSKQYQTLEQMRVNERQFLLTQESISNSLRDAASRSNMVPLVPERMLEVPIASPLPVEPKVATANQPTIENTFYPVGY
ncbi:MAG: hypothetical protein NW237_01495 [Cyanobacteriota bacterium]|nr:hypothetical protein [Cyanobacteriota bacterium]